MKTNGKMKSHRESLAVHKAEYENQLIEVEKRIAECEKQWRERCKEIYDCNIRMKHFSSIFGDLPNKKKHLFDEIKKMELELLEKKYANHYGYSDIEPYEVVEERTPNMYLIRWMKSVQTEKSKKELKDSFVAGGFCGHFDNDLQEWDITSCEDNQPFAIRRHKDGNWYDTYHRKYCISSKPIKFYDFNF